jgi:predicted ATP-dependent endonuclease of OLD family
MIEKLQLRNFRCFFDHTVSFRENTIVVGENNAGKSTIVEALRIISIVAMKYKYLTYKAVPNWLRIPSKNKGVVPSLKEYDFNFDSVFHRYSDPPAQVDAYFTTGESISVFIGSDGNIFSLIKDKDGQVVKSKGQAATLNIPRVLILPEISPLLREERKLDKDYVSQYLFSRLSSRHFRNELSVYSERYKEFKLLVESTWPSCRIKSFDKSGEIISLFVQNNDFVAEVGWMGSGLQMWLQIMWFLSFSTTKDVVILDEPDIYMHSDLQRKIIRLLLGGNYKQVIVATHSLEIISEVAPENILVVDRTKPISKFTTSVPSVQKIIDKIGSVHNIQLTRFWKCKKCILVEGKDLKILRHLQDTLFPTSDTPFETVPNMSIGGWGNWKFAIGSSMLLKNAADETINVYCILDRDYHTDSEITKLLDEASNNSVKLHVWKRKEIENYLIIPQAICRLINSKIGLENKVEEPELLKAVEQICDDMYHYTFGSILSHIAQENSREYQKAYQKALEKMKKSYRSLDGKLTLVSGKRVLSKMSEWSNKNYGVSFSVENLARELRREEILPEMENVIKAIEQNLDSI